MQWIDELRALDALHDRAYSSTLDARRLEELAALAGLPPDVVAEMRTQRMMARMREGLPP